MSLKSILFTSPVLKIKKFQFCVEIKKMRMQSATLITTHLQLKHTS